MTFAYFDCFAGIAGDMVLGALLDAGASEERLREALAGMPVDPFDLVVRQEERNGIAATRVEVLTRPSTTVRTWGAIRGLLGDAEIGDRVRERALDSFARLAAAEGRVHRTAPEDVHFHEVGAVDAVVDIVGAAVLLDDLGVEEAWASPVAVGAGMTSAAHGALPVPGPAVLELLRGAPVHAGGVRAELTTPTGAAILTSAVGRFAGLPEMRVSAIGYGAGSRHHDELPNLLRVVVGERLEDVGTEGDRGLVLEANIDDMSPELAPWVLARLLDAGAADAWLTPIGMKKGRPGFQLSVLCRPGTDAAMRALLWRETSTLGVRGIPVRKWMLERRMVKVEVGGGVVAVKLGIDGGRVVNAAPEFEDCARLAEETDIPLKEILALAQAAGLAHAAAERSG